MTPEQKHRAAELLSAWRATAYALHADRMAALLQELVDAPEPEPMARVTGYYAGYLSIATVDGGCCLLVLRYLLHSQHGRTFSTFVMR